MACVYSNNGHNWHYLGWEDTIEAARNDMKRFERYKNAYLFPYKFIVKGSDDYQGMKIVEVMGDYKFMEGWSESKAFGWIRNRYQKTTNLPEGTQYEAIAVDNNGEIKIIGDTVSDSIDGVWQRVDIVGIEKFLSYPYIFVITAHKGDNDNILKQRIVDMDTGLKIHVDFKSGWTVERAIKKIIAGNKRNGTY